jgi:hypothetical protein
LPAGETAVQWHSDVRAEAVGKHLTGGPFVITLSLKDSGASLGTIDDADLRLLMDQLEEESEEDTDYYINSATIDMLEQNGASDRLLALLKEAVGDTDGVDIVWEES